jgi:hypothetical protein
MAESTRAIPIQYEPKRVNRFVVEFPTELGIETWKVQTIKRPTQNINSVEIPFLNESNWVAGRYTWSTIDITFIDTIGPSTSIQLMEWARLHAESLTGRMGYAAGYKKDLIVKALDPNSVEVEKWLLEQCMIVTADFGNHDYGDDGLQMVTLTLQPYRCILNY